MKPRVRCALPTVALVVVGFVFACGPTTPRYEFPYAEMRAEIPNGMKLIVMPDDSTPLVQVDIRYHTGSNQDPPGKAGIAHFAEHMMFQYRIFGEDKPPLFDIIPQITTGFNAYTAPDTTHYYLQGRKDELVTFIRLEAARMAADCRKIPHEEFEREREVVRNELRQNYGRPEAKIPAIIHKEVFGKGHPYYYLGIGDDEQLANITQEDVCKFLDEYYVPQNATMLVAGNVDPEVVKNEVLFAFGAIEKGKDKNGNLRKVRHDPIPIPKIKHHTIVRELPVERDSVHIVWALPPAFSKKGEHINSLMFAMTAFVGQFAEDWDFATQVRPQFLGGYEAPVFVLSIELKSPGKLDEALEFVWKAAKNAHRPFESGTFTETKARQKGDLIASVEDLGSRTNQVADLEQFKPDMIEWDSGNAYLAQALADIDKTDPGDARSFIKNTLKKDKALVLVVKSNKEAEGFQKADLTFSTKSHDRKPEPIVDPAEANRPLVVPKEDSALGKAKRFKLGNGMQVVMLDEGRMPIVSMRLIFDVGSAHEPGDKPGLANLAAQFLNHPSGSSIGRIGASWGGFADDDNTTFTVRGINVYTKEMIVGLERMIKIGDYSQRAIESWQKRQRNRFKSRSFRQQQAFQREVGIALYGPDHPYAVKGSVTQSSVGKMGRDALVDFKRSHYTAKNATLIIAGNFDMKDAEEAIRDSFGDWDGGRKDKPIEASVQTAGSRAIGVIGDKLPQVQTIMAYPSPAGVDGQEAARRVLSEMLRLKMWEIRAELGSTYGVSAGRQARVGPGSYIIFTGIQAERAGETIKAMRVKLDELRNGVEFDAIFAQARRNVLKNLLAESTVSSALAGRLASIAVFGQNPDYYDKLTRYVAMLSPAQVKALITTELDPKKEVIGLLGDKETIEKAFTEAGFDTVKYIDVSE